MTDLNQEGCNTMEEISLGTDIGFKPMLKTLQERTVITMKDGAGNFVTTNDPLAISACVDQCVHTMLLWINTMSAKFRPLSPGTFNALLLKECRNLYHDKKDTDEKEAGNIVTKPERFAKKTQFPKCLIQIDG